MGQVTAPNRNRPMRGTESLLVDSRDRMHREGAEVEEWLRQ